MGGTMKDKITRFEVWVIATLTCAMMVLTFYLITHENEEPCVTDLNAPTIEEKVEVDKDTTPTQTSEKSAVEAVTEPIKEEVPQQPVVQATTPVEKKIVKEAPKPVVETPTKPVENTVDNTVENWVSLGNFTATAYCPCNSCSGGWGSSTATGAKATEGRTIAVDPKVIPYGTKVKINGHTYIAEDCGGAIKGNKIDIYYDTHAKTSTWGKRTVEVFVLR